MCILYIRKRRIDLSSCITNTFGTPGADEHAFFVRNVADAKRVQSRIKQLLELASLPGITEQEQKNLLHVRIRHITSI
jgi:NADH:ubiquinone reductase (non-electrogenic)